MAFIITVIFYLLSRGDLGNDPEILKLVQEQTTQWTELMHKHRKEEWEMLKTHLGSQEETFKKLCVTVQTKQMKDMETYFLK
jgi:phosphatidylinositol phospholipase C beta